MVYNGDRFEDEQALDDLALQGIDDFAEIPMTEQKIQFDGFEKAAAKAERRRERRRRRNERTGKIAACVIIVCILIAVFLALAFVRETEHVLYQDSYEPDTETPTTSPTAAKPTMSETPSPTDVPKQVYSVLTQSPTGPRTAPPIEAPTESPTVTQAPTSLIMDNYMFEPVADTYLHLHGPHKTKIYGREETLSIQRGNKESTLPGQEVTIPAMVSLIEFDLRKDSKNASPLPERSRWPEAENQVKVILRISHIPKDSPEYTGQLDIDDILPVIVEVDRLPNNHDLIIESLNGEGFQNAPPSVREGIPITQQKVEAIDTTVEIDITSAMFLPENTNGYGDDQVLLLLKVYWEEESNAMDMFASRESDGQSPQLIFSNMVSEEL